MNINFPSGAVVKQSPKLYFGKYPYRVELQLLPRERIYYSTAAKKFNKIIGKIKRKDLPSEIRLHDTWYCKTFYCTTEDNVNFVLSKLASYNPKKFSLIINTMTDTQVDSQRLDAKIVFRDELYFKKYNWRLEFKGGESDVFDSLQSQFFSDEENEKFNNESEKKTIQQYWWHPQKLDKRYRCVQHNERIRIKYGFGEVNTIVFCNDECDATIVMLTANNQVKITKIVTPETKEEKPTELF